MLTLLTVEGNKKLPQDRRYVIGRFGRQVDGRINIAIANQIKVWGRLVPAAAA